MRTALRVLPYALSGIVVGALMGGFWWLWADRAAKAVEIADLERTVATQVLLLAQIDEANDVLKAHLKRMEAENAKLDELAEALADAPGRDTPLSDLLRTAFGGL